MRIRSFLALWTFVTMALAGVLVTRGSAEAQSLAEVARQEDARRSVIRAASKVYTNNDLVPRLEPATVPVVPPAGGSSSSASSAGSSPAPSPGVGRGAAAPVAAPDAVLVADPVPVAGENPPRDEAYWRNRLKGLRDQLAQNQSYAEAMQTRVDVLTLQFTGRASEIQRTRTGVDRQKAMADLDRLKVAIEDGKKAIAGFDEEARRAGVPPGWLR